jgi:hypothetical protein
MLIPADGRLSTHSRLKRQWRAVVRVSLAGAALQQVSQVDA